MRLLIVRHGAPYYAKDTLTEQGWKEAELLAEHLVRMHPNHVYLSPMGRAQDTAKKTLELTGITPEVLPWLCEFDFHLDGDYKAMWHMDPKLWTSNPAWRGPDWKETEPFKGSRFLQAYEDDLASLNELLARHGYVRDGMLFRVKEEFYAVNETVVFFCHLGRGLTLLSQLLDMPWFPTVHQFWLPTSSVTEIVFERSHYDRGVAIARCARCGSVSHLDEARVARCNSGFLMPIDGYLPEEDEAVQLSQ